MDMTSRAVEERLAQAAANGELDTPTLHGKPIADLDRQRPAGWWADQFVARERSHDRRKVADHEAALDRAGFWRCTDVEALRVAVTRANDRIDAANFNMIPADRLDRFDVDDIIDRWRRVRR